MIILTRLDQEGFCFKELGLLSRLIKARGCHGSVELPIHGWSQRIFLAETVTFRVHGWFEPSKPISQ